VTKDINLKCDGIQLIHEDELFLGGVSKKYIESRLNEKHPNLVPRSGWLFQQFIKMGCSYAIPNLTDYYLVVDADVVFLKKISFFEDGNMLLTRVNKCHQPYFDFYERLLGETVEKKCSFIAHHMLICKSIMIEILNNIEKRFKKNWYDAILDNINSDEESMFSEYETYGHYLEGHYPQKVMVRDLRIAQRFKYKYLLRLLLNQVDYATIHNYKKPENNPKTDTRIYKWFVGIVRNKVQKQAAMRIKK
jgi:hypothetical protein